MQNTPYAINHDHAYLVCQKNLSIHCKTLKDRRLYAPAIQHKEENSKVNYLINTSIKRVKSMIFDLPCSQTCCINS